MIDQSWAEPFVAAGLLMASDVHAVARVAPRFAEARPDVLLGLAFAVRAPRLGHAGVELSRAEEQADREQLGRPGRVAAAEDSEEEADESEPVEALVLPWPMAGEWERAVLDSPMVGEPSESERPFVKQRVGERWLVMTRRIYEEQARVASAVRVRASAELPEGRRIPRLSDAIAAVFGGDGEGEAARAVKLAAERRLAIVVGGPGTGKTFSISRLLAVLLTAQSSGAPLVVKLAAPTGKAAARMREAIREATAPDATPRIDVPDAIRATLQSLEASTLHTLIGIRPDGSCRHDRDNPIAADVLVVDEVSMVDLALMRRLLDATPDDARLVLLGDRDQLASVEAGCVLGDLVSGAESSALARSVASFSHSHRFASAPDIGLVAACLQSHRSAWDELPEGSAARLSLAVGIMAGRAHARADAESPTPRIRWLGPPESAEGRRARPSSDQLASLAEPYLAAGTGYVARLVAEWSEGTFSARAVEPEFHAELLASLESYRVLAAHRRGPLGVAGLEAALTRAVRKVLDGVGISSRSRHWVGRPILVTQNAYDVKLMNGDVGLVVPTRDGPRAVFPGERRGEVKYVSIARLPPHQGALAMTVHKAQGSQFDRVAVVLAGFASPIQTRELVYTAVTRAKERLDWLGSEAELGAALGVRVQRASGLEPLLAEPAAC